MAAAIALSGCFGAPPRQPARPPAGVPPHSPATAGGAVPLPQNVPDAIPRFEPRSLYGNPPFYEVFGKRYYVMATSVNYVERGVASWYGPGFHKVRTSMGEPYDMYGMTAAHKTLPLPAYVRVTNLENGRSVVVRINDRGPFVGNRIIDLSYTAAAKLDMLRNGTAMVEVRALQPIDPAGNTNPTVPSLQTATIAPTVTVPAAATSIAPPPSALVTDAALPSPPSPVRAAAAGNVPAAAPATAPGAPAAAVPAGSAGASSVAAGALPAGAPAIAPAPVTSAPVRTLYVQAGAFADSGNAQRLADKLRGGGYGQVFVRDDLIGGRKLYRVRIGPVPSVPEFDRIVAALEQAGVRDAHLALD
jgi:rare lipoprotein A